MASNIVFATQGLQELIVTPDMASSWLSKRADYQRNISPVTVARYADAMRRGQWKFVPSQGIAITTEGVPTTYRLKGGRHFRIKHRSNDNRMCLQPID